jgi:hypothetical protein
MGVAGLAASGLLDKCSEPRNESRIAENHQKWEASCGRLKSKKKGSRNSGGGGGGANYERTKWAPPKSGDSGVCYIDGTHHAYCGKKHNGVVCGWNISHSTSYHKKWSEMGTAFNLSQECPTHELVLRCGSGSSGSSTTTRASSSSTSSSLGAVANNFVLSEHIRNSINQLNDSVRTPSEQLLAPDGWCDEKSSFKLGRPSNTGNLPPYLLNPVFLHVIWNLLQVVGSLLMTILFYCLGVLFHEDGMYLLIPSSEDEFISHSVSPLLPDSLDDSHLANFCSGIDPLACLSLMDSLSIEQDLSTIYASAAQDAIHRMLIFLLQEKGAFGASKCRHHHQPLHDDSRSDFKHLPLVWDTGALQGLTPFLNDFIHYEECRIQVNDISKVNNVIGIGTVMYKF